MGWDIMGYTQRCGGSEDTPNNKRRRYESNAGSFDKNRENMESGRATRYKRKYALPSIGDVFGELTVLGFNFGNAGGVQSIQVQCSCGAPPHNVQASNLRLGKSTRCNACAKKASGYYTKHFWGYADVVPDEAHRRRLLNRISACINRCRNPNDAAWPNYGGRGIRVHPAWVSDRKEYLRYLVSLDGWDKPNLELDRIDCDGDYAPGNLRFITKAENAKNKRSVPAMQSRIAELEARVAELEARLRHQECRP
jgi:hypothetical protein